MEENLFYDGFTVLSPISDIVGLPIDQINFIVCQVYIILFGYFFRKYLYVNNVSSRVRHSVEVFVGLSLAYFCFGRQIIHIFMQSIMCLILMKSLNPGYMEKMVLITAMAYLCIGHAYRFIYDYGGYTLDITGPLMLNTQRLSSMAFGLKDGHDLKNNKKLTELLKKKVIRTFPSLLEFASYILSFHNLMCGPFCFYTDYISFIEGTNYSTSSTGHMNGNFQQNGNIIEEKTVHPPSPYNAVLNKISVASVFGLSTIFVLPHYPVRLLKETEFLEYSFLYKMYLIIMVTSTQRHKYYFAWKLGEAGNNSAGLGYNGKDEKGNDRWDLIDNVDIWKVEFSTSLKVLVDNWNISTTYWLRYILYERVRSIIPVVVFSAFWHGFYPGYYITFCSGGVFITASRLMRSIVRPWFQKTDSRIFVYDSMTFTATRVVIAYFSFPFLTLEFWPSLYVFENLFFAFHIGAAILIFVLLAYKMIFGLPPKSA